MKVLETAHQVGRMSVSMEPEFSYKEMAHHCEALLTGKQQKMYNLMNSQHRQDNALIGISESSSDQGEESTSDNQVDNQVSKVVFFGFYILNISCFSFLPHFLIHLLLICFFLTKVT